MTHEENHAAYTEFSAVLNKLNRDDLNTLTRVLDVGGYLSADDEQFYKSNHISRIWSKVRELQQNQATLHKMRSALQTIKDLSLVR